MKLSKLTDELLLTNTKNCAKREKQALIDLLYHLREVDHRRLYSTLRHPSMFEYVVKDLEYSEPEALRRISAMRLMRDLPEIEGKVDSGSLSLTNMVLAQAMFSKEKKAGRIYDKAEKLEVLGQIDGKSTREAQAIVGNICPAMNSRAEMTFDNIEDEELRAKLLRLKGMLAHSDPHISITQLLHKICDEAIERRSPSAPKVKRENPKSQTAAPTQSAQQNVRYISRQTRYAVVIRDKNKCTNCGSHHALQVDHIIPLAKGGSSDFKNLRLLCRACNQRAAMDEFGVEKIANFISDVRGEYGVH